MDTYLPADFHALHQGSADDWRDASNAFAVRARAHSDDDKMPMVDPHSRCADPNWLVI